MRQYHPTRSQVQTREISGIRHCGSIVIVLLQTDRFTTPVFFDWRQFQHLLDGENCRPDELIGRQASFDGQSLTLLE